MFFEGDAQAYESSYGVDAYELPHNLSDDEVKEWLKDWLEQLESDEVVSFDWEFVPYED